MRSPMDKEAFLQFYKNTIFGYSKSMQERICKKLKEQKLITFNLQGTLEDDEDILFFKQKSDYQTIIESTCSNEKFAAFYEQWEFSKLFKYSVPLFFKSTDGKDIKDILISKKVIEFTAEQFKPDYILDEDIKNACPIYFITDDTVMLKFVLQKMYYQPETHEQVEYRYPIVISIFDNFLDIRFDQLRYSNTINIVSRDAYEKIVFECILWLQNELGLELYKCDHTDIIKVINDRNDTSVVMYKQMMELSSGGAAELTASDNRDYVLPFIGEIRELIEENNDLFSQNDEIKKLLLQYLEDKEATANYPYIYIKWKKPVVTKSYVVKVIFDYLNHQYTMLQHNTGECRILEMERMNNAIKYLCTSSSFIKGEKI